MGSAFQFPAGFLWGAATSAHQVEGNNIHSDWWAWEQAGKVNEPSGLACDHYRRFADDFELAASLGHNTHRFSIEWSRIEPADGQWDDAALAHYADVLTALRQRRLEPVVTLHHFTSPQWITAQGGWVNPKVIEWFARYVRRVVEALGDRATYWITINEPLVFVRMHYLQGLGPPGATNVRDARTVIEHLVQAHVVAYHIVHEASPAHGVQPNVSIAHFLPPFHPCRWWSPMDWGVVALADRLFNWSFLEKTRHTLDFLGVNFYGRRFIRWTRSGNVPVELCDLTRHRHHSAELTSFGWDVHPPSFTQMLVRASRFGLPMLVTENGIYATDDAQRWRYLERHVQAMATAMRAGVPMIGYCYWSLLDNFEWADGFAPRFGLVEVDYATQQRRVRNSGHRYAELCRNNCVMLNV